MSKRVGKNLIYLTDLSKFTFIEPRYAIVLTFVLFTFAGTPPTIMFFSKLYILKALLMSGKSLCAIVVLVANVYSSLYYIKLVKILLTRGHDFDTDVVKVRKKKHRILIRQPVPATSPDELPGNFLTADHSSEFNTNHYANIWYNYTFKERLAGSGLEKFENTTNSCCNVEKDETAISGDSLPITDIDVDEQIARLYIKLLEAIVLSSIVLFIGSAYIINDNLLLFFSNIMTSCWLSLTLDSSIYFVNQMLYADRFASTSDMLLIFLNLS